MNLHEIQDLIKFVAKSGVSEVEIEQKDFKIVIKAENKSKGNDQPIYVQASAPASAALPVAAAPVSAAPIVAAPVDENANYIVVKSPMIGTFTWNRQRAFYQCWSNGWKR
jgi:acetyl-CoA carboxylase biotin carboxyl carrier protein